MTAEPLIGCLRLVPALRELIIYSDTFSSGAPDLPDLRVWTSLTPTADNLDNLLCPKLQSVKFLGFNATPDSVLLAFVRARTESHFIKVSHLSSVRAQFWRPRQMDIVPALHQAIANGLDLSLLYAPPIVDDSPSQDNLAYTTGGEALWHHWGPAGFGIL